MSFVDKMKEAGEDIKAAFQDGAHDLADKAGDLKDAAAEKAADLKDAAAEKAGDLKDAAADAADAPCGRQGAQKRRVVFSGGKVAPGGNARPDSGETGGGGPAAAGGGQASAFPSGRGVDRR